MCSILKELQNQFIGYSNTPLLWNNDEIFGLNQLKISKPKTSTFISDIPENMRLGKRVERFVFHEFENHPEVDVLAENIQVQHHKITLGELDSIINYNGNTIHLEIVYKFYLFDKDSSNSEIGQWIGPNRNDSLSKKLDKLRIKQLPLLYSPECKPILQELDLDLNRIKQYVLFKAQLFLPLHIKKPNFKFINEDCIIGFYIHHKQLDQFLNCKFYMPKKSDWLIEIQTQITWLNYKEFAIKIDELISKNTSPLCWIKYPNGEFQKCFVVWWN